MSSGKVKRLIQRSVYLSTPSKPKPPKEKHVVVILKHTFTQGGSFNHITNAALEKRLDKQSYSAVLKTLLIIHRLYRDGHETYIDSLKGISSRFFALRRYSSTAPPNHLLTVFVKKYAKYLEEKVSVVRLIGFQFERNRKACKEAKVAELFKLVPKLQSQLNALLNTKMKSGFVSHNHLLQRCYVLLLRDSLVLYQMLNDGILALLDVFWNMNKKDGTLTLSIYRLFVKETDALITMYEMGSSFVRNLPKIKKAESSFVSEMEKYVNGLKADSSSTKKGKEGSRRRAKAQESESSSSSEESSSSDEELVTESASSYEEDDFDDYEDSDESQEDEESEEESSDEYEDDTDFFKTFLLATGGGANPFTAALFANRPPEVQATSNRQFTSQRLALPSTTSRHNRSVSMGPAQVVNPFTSSPTRSVAAPKRASVNPFANTQSPTRRYSVGVAQSSKPIVNPFLTQALVPSTQSQPSFFPPSHSPAHSRSPSVSGVVNPFMTSPAPSASPSPQPAPATTTVNPFL